MTNETSIQKIVHGDLAAETSVYTSYLTQMGLPTDNIIASTTERNIVAFNLASFLETLSADEKREARYLSKFVGASSVGLFDAALNYVWNEVVLNLRKKATIYGIDFFFDSAVGGKNRVDYKDESDLSGIKDTVLLDTCKKLELISEVVYCKIDHILTMRNEVAASHPNVESIGGFELLGWLQTCVKDVLQDKPSESAIRIRALVSNLNARTSVIDEETKQRIVKELRNLSLPHLNNLLVTFFGMFVAEATDQIHRKNISILAPNLWSWAETRIKYQIGNQIDGYRTNLHEEKLAFSIEFLTLVNGKEFETLPARTIALQTLAARLADAHTGHNNYYNEPPVMREILSYCKRSSDIPKELLPVLTSTVLACRLGRGLSYRQGVSPGGQPLYDQFLGILDDDGVVQCFISLFSWDLNSKIRTPICQGHLSAVLKILKDVAIADRLKQALDYLLANVSLAYQASSKPEFKELTSPFLTWR